MATTTAAIPVGTLRSARTTPPLPTTRRSRPTAALARHWRGSSGGAPRARAQTSTIAPARAKREPLMTSGGSVSIAMAIAR
jgi:hypothetical protein